MRDEGQRQLRFGFLLAILAAGTFGVTAPIVQRLGVGVGPLSTAALLYAGAAALAAVTWERDGGEAPLRWRHSARLAGMALFGATMAPTAFAWGLQRTSALSASLALNFEAVFTAGLGWLLYREHLGRRVVAALGWMTLGGVLLVVGRAHDGRNSLFGLLAVLAATLGWAVDNALASGLSLVDPSKVVFAKATLGALLSTVLALRFQEHAPSPSAAVGLLACGASGYGLSLRLYLQAQRRIGAARTASLFALAPFVAAFAAVILGAPFGGAATAIALVPMLLGLRLHLTEEHKHFHRHARVLHEHAHRHDDSHHDHAHVPPVAGEHSHAHEHEPKEHAHAHLPDPHHTHEHE